MVFQWREKILCSEREISLTLKWVIKRPLIFPNLCFWGESINRNNTTVIWSVLPLVLLATISLARCNESICWQKTEKFVGYGFQILTLSFHYCFVQNFSFINGSIFFIENANSICFFRYSQFPCVDMWKTEWNKRK